MPVLWDVMESHGPIGIHQYLLMYSSTPEGKTKLAITFCLAEDYPRGKWRVASLVTPCNLYVHPSLLAVNGFMTQRQHDVLGDGS